MAMSGQRPARAGRDRRDRHVHRHARVPDPHRAPLSARETIETLNHYLTLMSEGLLGARRDRRLLHGRRDHGRLRRAAQPAGPRRPRAGGGARARRPAARGVQRLARRAGKAEWTAVIGIGIHSGPPWRPGWSAPSAASSTRLSGTRRTPRRAWRPRPRSCASRSCCRTPRGSGSSGRRRLVEVATSRSRAAGSRSACGRSRRAAAATRPRAVHGCRRYRWLCGASRRLNLAL